MHTCRSENWTMAGFKIVVRLQNEAAGVPGRTRLPCIRSRPSTLTRLMWTVASSGYDWQHLLLLDPARITKSHLHHVEACMWARYIVVRGPGTHTTHRGVRLYPTAQGCVCACVCVCVCVCACVCVCSIMACIVWAGTAEYGLNNYSKTIIVC